MLPEDIEAKEFLMSLRGYDRDEVNAYLRQVAEEYRAALSGVSPAPESFEALGQEVGNVLQVARESADAMLRDAQGRAGALIAAAEADREAARQAGEVSARVEELKETEAKMRQRLYALQVIVESLREDLENAVRHTSEIPSPRAEPAAAPKPPGTTPPAPEPPAMAPPAPPAIEGSGSDQATEAPPEAPSDAPPGAPAGNGDAPPASGEEGTFLQRVMSSARRWSLL